MKVREEIRHLKRCRDYVIKWKVLDVHVMCPVRNAKCKATCAFYVEYIKEPVMPARKKKRIVKCNFVKADIGEI